MSTESGYTNAQKWGRPQHKTIHHLGSSRYGQHVVMKSVAEKNAIAVPILSVTESTDKSKLLIEVTAHQAKKGDIVRFVTGNVGAELDIIAVSDANHFVVYNVLDVAPVAGDTVKIMFYVSSKSDAEGNVNFSPGPTQFVLDGASEQVIQDTAVPANNKPLPAGMYFYKDGVIVPVRSDSLVPSNSAPLPVELFGFDGGTINITAGDLNIQTSDMGATFDSMRIGDGSGIYLKINADGSVNVKDADALAQLQALNLVDFATEAKQDAGNASLASIDTKLTSQATGAKQDTGNASLTSIDTKLTDLATRATEATLSAINAKLPSSIGQKAPADSLSIVPATGTSMPVTSTTLATIAKQDEIIAKLTEMDTAVDAMSLKLPSVIGKNLPADSMSVTLANGETLPLPTGAATSANQTTEIAKLTEISGKLPIGPNPKALSLSVTLALDNPVLQVYNVVMVGNVITEQKTVGLVAVRATVGGAAPDINRKKLVIKPSANNTGKIYIGGSTLTTANGMEIIGPDRLEFEKDTSDYFLISDTAGQVVEIMEVV